TWQQDAFAYAESYDEASARYRGLRGGKQVSLGDGDIGLLVKSDVARVQLDAEASSAPTRPAPVSSTEPSSTKNSETGGSFTTQPLEAPKPKRFHGSVMLDATR